MDEHTEEPKPADGPDPQLSPLHEGQLSLIPDAPSAERSYDPGDTASWSPVPHASSSDGSADAARGATSPHGGMESQDAAADARDDAGQEQPAVDEDVDTAHVQDADTDPDSHDLSGSDDEGDPMRDAARQAAAKASLGSAMTAIAQESENTDSAEQVQSAVAAQSTDPACSPDAADPIDPADGSVVTPPAADEDTTGATDAWTAVRTPSAGPSVYDLPALDRPRPERDRFVPRWVYIAVAAAIVVLALVAGGVVWYANASEVDVPDVTGVQLEVARTRLEAVGLEVQVEDRRFSAAPRDEVLGQSPSAGATLRRGSLVRLVISAGTEEIVMPDVVGDGLNLARAELERRGLVVIVDAVPSDVPSDTVLGTTPAPGAIVRTGDTVRVTVAAPVGGSGGLSPYNMQGLGIVIDPAPTGTATDTTMEVARRLRSLLEASGATVNVLRSATDTSAADPVRAQAAQTATGTIAIGLSVAPSGPAGRVVSIPVTGTPDALQRSQLLASSITSQLATVAPPVRSQTSSNEMVLQATRLAWARIVLGSVAAREDQTRFNDPAWADQMARAIYTSLGELYGVRGQ